MSLNVLFWAVLPSGLPVHLGAGQLQQRPDPPDQQRHQERPEQPQPHLHEFGASLHRQRGQPRDGRGLRLRHPPHPRGRVRACLLRRRRAGCEQHFAGNDVT